MIKRKLQRFICTETEPVVSTTSGKLRGYIADDVYCFRGIEYAYAERYRMPEPVPAWEGVKDALSYGRGSPDETFAVGGINRDQLLVPGLIWPVSEHCQNLNVWTRSIDPSAKRPVMVWFHGGGFMSGSATHLYSYDGYEMAKEFDVVVVTVNHRLNLLGYFDLSAYGERYEHSGNLGMADLVAALQWVHDNIAGFGGDPDNVTIYGQSGGGGKVITLMQMPAADGLYHRAIIQSGVIRSSYSSDNAAKLTAKAVEILGLNEKNIHEIEKMDYNKISNAIKQAAAELGNLRLAMLSPVPDGTYYVGSPFDVGFRPETKHIPLIAGTVIAEFPAHMPIGNKAEWTDERRLALLKEYFGDGAEEVKAQFRKAYPKLDWSYAVSVDTFVRTSVLEFLDLRCSEAKAPVHNYVFTFESPLMGGQLLTHNGELHFMFHNAEYMEAMCRPGVTGRLQDIMAGAWAQFARTGSPNGEGLPVWEPYTSNNKACIVYGDETALTYGHDSGLMEILRRYPPKNAFNF